MATERRWAAVFLGSRVLLRNWLIPDPGEDLTDDPPTVTLTAQEFANTHADYGLTADGRQSIDVTAVRAAMQRLKDKAAVDQDWAALVRVLRAIATVDN